MDEAVTLDGVGSLLRLDGTEGEGETRSGRDGVQFKTAMAAIQGILWTNSADGEMRGEQVAWAAFTGQTQAEYQGYGWAKAVHPEDAEPTVEAWKRAVAERRMFLFEHRLRRHDGEYRLFSIRALPVLDGAGEIEEWVGVHTDITDSRRTEEALRESEARFRLLTDLMPQLVWSTLPDGYHDYYNQRWYEYVGADFLKSSGEGWSTFLHPDDVMRAREIWQHSLGTGNPYEVEYRFRRHDGVYRWFLGRAFPLRDESGTILRWIGTCTDIEDQKRAEETLVRQQDEIARLNARLRQAMVETHHRVKNNLQMISALIDIQRDSGNAVSQETLESLSQSVRALGVIHELLTREAKTDGIAQHLATQSLLGQLVEVHQGTITGRRIHASIDDIRLPGKLATSLTLVANEYIANALKHGSSDVEVRFQLEGDRATLEVCDDGPGFPEEFDPAVSANTGLELINYMVGWELNGTAEYTNRSEGGARVTVRFPVPVTEGEKSA